jgi:hypothetical protein
MRPTHPRSYSRGVSRVPEPVDPDDDWQPATSAPGELYTFEGQMRSLGAFVRGRHNDDPRAEHYRGSMQRTAWTFVGIALGVIVLSVVVSAVL